MRHRQSLSTALAGGEDSSLRQGYGGQARLNLLNPSILHQKL